jgi:AmmeMemoRadiSam system protein A
VFGVDDQRRLLAIARRALDARVRRTVRPPLDTGGAVDAPRGAFVSIHRQRALRGCLGRLEADWPVCRVVAHLGKAVSDSDPRFAPVTVDELGQLHIEISVLTPGREIHRIDEIAVGRHGLIVEDGRQRGLLLPQVAVEHGWQAQAFLQHTCLKAGLPREAWRSGARVLVFEAQVFREGPAPSAVEGRG